jgi:hypothetical protein
MGNRPVRDVRLPRWLPLVVGVIVLGASVAVTSWFLGDDTNASSSNDVAVNGVDAPLVERDSPEDCSKLEGQFAMTTEVLYAARESAVGVNGYYTIEIVATPRDDGCDLALDVVKLGYGKDTTTGRGDFKKQRPQSGSGELDWFAETREWAGHFRVSSQGGTAQYALSISKAEGEFVGVWRNVGTEWESSRMSGRLHVWRGAQNMQPPKGPATNRCLWECLEVCHVVPDGRGRADLSACVGECGESERSDGFASNCPL